MLRPGAIGLYLGLLGCTLGFGDCTLGFGDRTLLNDLLSDHEGHMIRSILRRPVGGLPMIRGVHGFRIWGAGKTGGASAAGHGRRKAEGGLRGGGH